MKKPGINSRRKILLGLSGMIGATQLSQWSKPVIKSVVLPAHAETTVPVNTASQSAALPSHFRNDIQLIPAEQDIAILGTNDLLSLFVPEAHAGRAPRIIADLSINSPVGTAFTAKMLVQVGDGTSVFRTASGTVNGGPTPLVDSSCGFPDGSIEVTSISGAGAAYSLIVGGGNSAGTLPAGTGEPSGPVVCPPES